MITTTIERSAKMTDVNRFGEFFKQRRIALRKTLRQFCRENELDAGNISRLERGLLPPPQGRAILESYANLLKLKKGSDDWYTFFDLAAAETGRIPQELLEDDEVLEKLPILFRTLRGQKVPDEQLDELVRTLRKV
jgi:transcriptional regulator with XRE-family HTH domain